MAFLCRGVLLLLCLAVAGAVHAGAKQLLHPINMKLDCGPNHVSLVWRESRPQVDPSLVRLGSCLPTSQSVQEAVFFVELTDCGFRRLVTGDQIVYTNALTYISPDSPAQSFTHPVVCTYERPEDWYPMNYDPVFLTVDGAALVFSIEIMNEDFSGPAESTRFSLGSFVPIVASVEQNFHQPLLLLLEECVATTTPELYPDSHTYNIITNDGCLVDSKISGSRFEPRQSLSELRLSLQAFRFAVGEEVFIHCKLLAWNPDEFSNTKKTCHYSKEYGWEMLDNPAYSNLCDCCDASCRSRWTRTTVSGKHGTATNAILGPLTFTDGES